MSKQENKVEPDTVFDVKISQQDFAQVLKSSSVLTEEVTLHFDVEGLTIREMDPSHVGLIDISLPNTIFEKYDVQGEFDIGIRLDEIEKMVKMFHIKSNITLSKKGDLLVLSNRSETYKIRTIEKSKTDNPLPKIPFDVRVDFKQEISTKDFIKQLDKISVISDYVTFNTTSQRIVLSGKGDIGEAETTWERGQVGIETREDSDSTYSLEFILPFVKSIKDLEVSIAYSTQKPLRIETQVAKVGRIHYYLAPRVED